MGVILSIFLPLFAPLIAMVVKPILPVLKYFHHRWTSPPKVTADFIQERLYISLQVIPIKPLDESILKTLYRFIYTILENIVLYHLTPSKVRQHDQHVVDMFTIASKSNQAMESLKKQIKQTSNVFSARDIIDANQDLHEIITKTNIVFEKKLSSAKETDDAQLNVARFLVGQGHALNCKLSQKVDLDEKESKIKRDIDRVVSLVEPLSYGITLFHGFEQYVNYQFVYSEEYIAPSTDGSNGFNSKGVGKRFLQLPGFIAKTPCHSFAISNASKADSLRPRVLIITYPVGSKHIHFNVRYKDSEFDYLGHSNERLEVLSEHFVWKGKQMITYYVCRPSM